MGDVYLIYQEARPTDIIKITALPFWPKYVYEADKRPFIYDGIGIKRPVIVFVQDLLHRDTISGLNFLLAKQCQSLCSIEAI